MVAGCRPAEQTKVDTIGHERDLAGGMATADEIVLEALADRHHPVGLLDHAVFQRPREAVPDGTLASRAIADGGILQEGADLVDDGDAEAAPGAHGGHAAQCRGMGVEDVRPPLPRHGDDGVGKGGDLAPFAKAGRARSIAACALEGQSFGLLHLRPLGRMAQSGDAAHLISGRLLRGHDRAGAKGIAAVQRQRVIEDVADAGHCPVSLPEQP